MVRQDVDGTRGCQTLNLLTSTLLCLICSHREMPDKAIILTSPKEVNQYHACVFVILTEMEIRDKV